jgi:hypothetical protein
MPTSQQSVTIHLNNGSSQFVVKYIFSLGPEGAHTACRFIVKLDAAAKGFAIFCEGDQENGNNGKGDKVIVWQKSNLQSLL